MSLATVQDWVRRAADRRLDRVAWIDRPHGGGARGPGLGHATRGGRGQRPGSLRRRGSPPGPPRVGTPRCPRDLDPRAAPASAGRPRRRTTGPPSSSAAPRVAGRWGGAASRPRQLRRRLPAAGRPEGPGGRAGAPVQGRRASGQPPGPDRDGSRTRQAAPPRPPQAGADYATAPERDRPSDAEPSLQRVAGMSRHLPAFDQPGDRDVVAPGPCSSSSEIARWPG